VTGRHRGTTAAIGALGASIVLIFLISTAFLLRERQTLLTEYARRGQIQAQLVAEHASAALREIQALLDTAALLLTPFDADAGLPADAQTQIRRRALSVPGLANLVLLGGDGVATWQLRGSMQRVDAAPHLAAHRDQGIDFRIGPGGASGVPLTTLSRRIEDPDRVFAGVLLAVVDPERFTSRYRDYGTVDVDLIALYDNGGSTLLLWSADPAGLDAPGRVYDHPLLADLSPEELSASGLRVYTRRRSITAMFQLRDFPVRVVLSYDRAAAARAWARQAAAVYVFATLLAITAAVATLALRTSAGRRISAEIALERSRARGELMQIFRRIAVLAEMEEQAEPFLRSALHETRIYLGWPLACAYLEPDTRTSDGAVGAPPVVFAPDPAAARAVTEPTWIPDLGNAPVTQNLGLPALEGHAGALVPVRDPLRGLYLYVAPPGVGSAAHLIETLTQISSLLTGTVAHRREAAERERLRAQLEQARRLESLGVLAGGVAHDFNNLLTVVVGHADILAQTVAQSEATRDSLEAIQTAAGRAADLASRMLAFAGRTTLNRQPVDVRGVLEDLDATLREGLPVGARLTVRSDRTPPLVMADPAALRHVVSELVHNAYEALPVVGGQVTVTAGQSHFDRAYLDTCFFYEALPEGRYATIDVSDTGSGIDPRVLDSLYQPFISTKFLGRGLGLSSTLGIVREHRGTLRIDSHVGEGTTVRVLLPAADDPGSLMGHRRG
jgi:signal transduction histidine kinase